MLVKFMEILVSRGRSQGASQGGSSSARSFDLACPGVAPPLSLMCLVFSELIVTDNTQFAVKVM